MRADYPYHVKISVMFKIGKKLEIMAEKQDISVSQVIRSIVNKYFELNPSEGVE